jgi:hypothetical protein
VNKVALALVGAVLLSACSRNVAAIDRNAAVAGGTASATKGPTVNQVYEEDQPETAESDVVSGPVNLPSIPKAPTATVDPANMVVKALALTNTNMPAASLGQFKTVVIRARITWTPVKGAVGYRVYKLDAKEGQAEDAKGKIVYTTPKWIPAAIVGGGFGLLNLAVGQEYIFTIEAIDRAGNVIATGKDNCAPLAPLEIPYLKEPGQNTSHVGQTPYFSWAESRGADGYYTEVFSTIKGTMPAIPMWRGFRANGDSTNAQYGTQVDVFSGTRPLQWSAPLNVGSRYAWTVSAIRTDSHDMHNAKAIAQATAPLAYFLP